MTLLQDATENIDHGSAIAIHFYSVVGAIGAEGQRSRMYFVVMYQGRCMGFVTDEAGAQRLAGVFGPGSDYEACEGKFPTDETVAAAEHNARLAERGNVVTLRPETGCVPVEVTDIELDALAEALDLSGLDEDPWAGDEDTSVRGPESGFFSAKVS